ncbi:MAG: hypothetical protein JNM86_10735 [Phycisphaerae bacterium]|nr:hypothetical protein [Phycisphaerae bacterium]
MSDRLPQNTSDSSAQRDLSPQAVARRDAMLPELLSEVRRIRRRRTTTRLASIAGVFILSSGILTLALLRTAPHSLNQPLAKAPATTPDQNLATRPAPSLDSHPVQIEIVQTSPDILARLSFRTPSLVRVEYINTDQALALLESTGNRYGTIEIAGRVEFQLIAQK